MKRVFSILFALALVLAFSLITATPVAADAGYRMVDDDGKGWVDIDTGAHDCDSTAITVVTSIAAGIAATPAGGTLFVCPGTYVESPGIVIDKNLTIMGADSATTIIKPSGDTASNGGMFEVNPDVTFHISDVTLDGTGKKVWYGLKYKGGGSVTDCDFKNIQYEPSGASYQGIAICAYGEAYDATIDFDDNVDITGCTFTGIGRVGVLYFGPGITDSTYSGNTYVGKGDGNWLDYALDVGSGPNVAITSNMISNCTGVATSDGSTSSGIMVTDYYKSYCPAYNSTEATITGNTLTGNTYGIAVGYDASDASVVTAHFNDISGNADGVDTTSSTVTTDATYNWWGADDGPGGLGPGSGDTASANVLFVPWACQPTTGGLAYLTPSAGVIDDLTPVSTPPNPPATFPYGMFAFKITGLSTGQEVTLTIELPGPVPKGTKWWKFHNNTWSPMDIGDDDGDNVITVALKDGRTPDDEDLVDGQITDQGGPGNPAVGWETYPVNKVRVFLPWITLFAAGVSLLMLKRRQPQS